MIWHQTKRSYVDFEQIRYFFEQIDKELIISFLYKQIRPPANTIHDMVPGIRVIYMEWSRHRLGTTIQDRKVNRRLDIHIKGKGEIKPLPLGALPPNPRDLSLCGLKYGYQKGKAAQEARPHTSVT